MTIGEKIKARRKELGISVDELAKAIGKNRATVYRYESSDIESMPASVLIPIADALHLTPADLLSNPSDHPTPPPVTEMVLCNVPVYESVSAGFGAYPDESVVDYMPLPFRTVAESEDFLVIRVQGDSMEPKICGGDFVLVRKQDSVDSGDVAVLYLDEEGLVKKVKYGDDWIELVSFNPYYPPRRFEGPEVLRIRIEGKVFRIIRDME